jgi:DNA-binding response OmpR family regulator
MPDIARCPLCDHNHHDPETRPRETRVLVVEDDAAIAALIAHNLERSGYRVTIAADGIEALRRLRQSAPDLVVLDLLLPLRSGWQVLREMRTRGARLASVPVLLVTALACERLAGDLPRLGAQRLLGKPFAVAELCRAACELIDARREAAAPPS